MLSWRFQKLSNCESFQSEKIPLKFSLLPRRYILQFDYRHSKIFYVYIYKYPNWISPKVRDTIYKSAPSQIIQLNFIIKFLSPENCFSTVKIFRVPNENGSFNGLID